MILLYLSDVRRSTVLELVDLRGRRCVRALPVIVHSAGRVEGVVGGRGFIILQKYASRLKQRWRTKNKSQTSFVPIFLPGRKLRRRLRRRCPRRRASRPRRRPSFGSSRRPSWSASRFTVEIHRRSTGCARFRPCDMRRRRGLRSNRYRYTVCSQSGKCRRR